MIRILQIIDISQMFNHFAQNKCINHQTRRASSVCLHEDCWKLEYDKAFYCEDCNVDHKKRHGNSMRFNALFTDELLEELDEYSKNQNTKDNLQERIRKFDEKINDFNIEIEQWTRCQFAALKEFFESHLINLHVDYFQAIKNLKQMLSEAQRDLSLNYGFKEKVNKYCIQIQKIQNDFNYIVNAQVIDDAEKKDVKMNEKLDSMLQKIRNEIKNIIKNQVNQMVEENFIDSTTTKESLKNEVLMEEETNHKKSYASILIPEIPIVKNL